MTLPAPTWDDPRVVVALLLLAGHVLSDFLFQTRAVVARKRASVRGLVEHVLVVFVVQTLALLPYARSHTALAVLVGIAATHLLIDWAKVRLDTAWPRQGTTWLLLDQALHLAVLGAALAVVPVPPATGHEHALALVALTALVFTANGRPAGLLVEAVLAPLQTARDTDRRAGERRSPRTEPAATAAGDDDGGPEGAGARIGVLERWIVLGLACAGEWGAIGLVLTAKSVARFKRMEEQAFAEVYLVGTMTSVGVAMASGALLRWALG